MVITVTVKCGYTVNLDSRIILPESGSWGKCERCSELAVRRENDPTAGMVTITSNGYHPIFRVEIAKK